MKDTIIKAIMDAKKCTKEAAIESLRIASIYWMIEVELISNKGNN